MKERERGGERKGERGGWALFHASVWQFKCRLVLEVGGTKTPF